MGKTEFSACADAKRQKFRLQNKKKFYSDDIIDKIKRVYGITGRQCTDKSDKKYLP